jgi:hypothetical protein
MTEQATAEAAPRFAPIEQEAILLNAVWSMIDEMVNYELFVKDTRVHDTNLMFNTSTHTRLFNILLGDFLALPRGWRKAPAPFGLAEPPRDGRASDGTYLYYLRQIAAAPQLGRDFGPVQAITERFSTWLEGACVVEDIWLPTIDYGGRIKVQRIEFLRICGNLAKHNFSRLQGDVQSICRVLASNGVEIDEGQGFLVLPEFYDWFHRNIFIYHSSTIAEFLNDLRWAIYDYLMPEFVRAYERCDPEPMYRFNYPSGVKQPLAQAMYWDLMNAIRSKPYFPRFTVTRSLKDLY